MKVVWETPSLINNSVMVRDNVPPPVREQVCAALLKLIDTTEGKNILAGMETARFSQSSNADYEVVTRYVARFEKEVRPVEQK
jgi:phosphonate transport system substrate-binding protein